MMKKIAVQISALIFGVTGGIFGVFFLCIPLSWIFGGKERVIKFISSTSGKELGIIEWIGAILGMSLGFGAGVFLWTVIMKKFGWLGENEILKFLKK